MTTCVLTVHDGKALSTASTVRFTVPTSPGVGTHENVPAAGLPGVVVKLAPRGVLSRDNVTRSPALLSCAATAKLTGLPAFTSSLVPSAGVGPVKRGQE